MTGPPADPAGPRPLPTAEDTDRLFAEVAPSRSRPSAPQIRLRLPSRLLASLLAPVLAPADRIAAAVRLLRTPVAVTPPAAPVPPRGTAPRTPRTVTSRGRLRPAQAARVAFFVIWLAAVVWNGARGGRPDQSGEARSAPAATAAPASTAAPTEPEALGGRFLVPLDSVPAGSCAVLFPPSRAGSAAVVDCTEPHDVLVLGRSESVVPPDRSGAGADAAARCAGLYRDAVAPGRTGGITAVLPTDAEWAAGRRTTVCVVRG